MVATARPLDLVAAPEPRAVGVLRRQVRRWLAALLDDTDAVDDLVLALSEALENVVDHAFADTQLVGSVTVNARHDGDRVVITVSDNGHWQRTESSGGGFRGRGLSLINQLTESSTVDTGPTGTTVTLVHSC